MRLTELLEENMPIRKRMEAQYKFEPADAAGAFVFQIKSGDSFPWKITPHGESVTLAQAFSPRRGMEAKFKKVKDFPSVDAALEHVAKKHNKSTEWMTHWKMI